jgi:hypothetical protein
MSRGKYSLAYKRWPEGYEFKYNCFGQEPAPWTQEMIDAGEVYDSMTMMDGYDEEGFDRYGYSAFDNDGEYLGHMDGVDRDGWTEDQYLRLEDLSPGERATYYD